MCYRLVSLQTKTNSELMVMEVVVQEESHIKVDDIIILLCDFPESAAVCVSLSETDRYTDTCQNTQSAWRCCCRSLV